MTTTRERAEVHQRQRWQDWLGGVFTSSIGLKWLMALTGIGLLAYVLAHLIGNSKVFLGQNEFGEYEIDLYGEALRNLGGDWNNGAKKERGKEDARAHETAPFVLRGYSRNTFLRTRPNRAWETASKARRR